MCHPTKGIAAVILQLVCVFSGDLLTDQAPESTEQAKIHISPFFSAMMAAQSVQEEKLCRQFKQQAL